MLSILGKVFSRRHFDFCFYFIFQRRLFFTFRTQFTRNFKSYFLEKYKKNIISLSSAEFAQKVVKVKQT